MNEELTISKRTKYGYDIIDIVGEITFEDSKKVENYIQSHVTGETRHVIMNLASVPFINSSALSLLVKIMQELSATGIDLLLMNPNETIRGLLEITGVKRYFKFINNENELIDKLKSKELNDMLDLKD